MKEKMSIIVGIGIAVLVIFTLAFYLVAKETIKLFDIVSVLIIIILV